MLIPRWLVSIGSSRHIIPIFTSPMSLISSLRILTVSYLSFRTYPCRNSLITCLSNPHLPFSILTCCHLPCHPSVTVISFCAYTVLLPSPPFHTSFFVTSPFEPCLLSSPFTKLAVVTLLSKSLCQPPPPPCTPRSR